LRTPAAGTLPPAPRGAPETPPQANERRRPRTGWVAVAIASVVIVAAAVVLVTSRDESPTRTTGTGGPQAETFRIAFSAGRPSGSAIFAVDSDGTHVTQLTDGRDEDVTPAISPDGTKIVFVRQGSPVVFEGEGLANLTVMNADGTNVHRLIGGIEDWIEPAWSLDGRKLAVAAIGDGIFVMNADGTGFFQITFGNTDRAPTWSPDGSQIAFERNGGVAIVNEDGSGLTILTRSTDDLGPAWSPDGSKIAFSDLSDIFLMNPDGSDVERLTGGLVSRDQQPAWSPDGEQIIFVSTRGSAVDCGELCVPELFIMNADGNDMGRVFDAPFITLDPSTAAI